MIEPVGAVPHGSNMKQHSRKALQQVGPWLQVRLFCLHLWAVRWLGLRVSGFVVSGFAVFTGLGFFGFAWRPAQPGRFRGWGVLVLPSMDLHEGTVNLRGGQVNHPNPAKQSTRK